MTFRPTIDYAVNVVSDLAIIGSNPENADMDNPYGHIFGEVPFVELVLDDGRRYEHKNSFADFDEAHMFRQEVEDHLLAGGELVTEHWPEVDPVYGSDAYCSQGIEQERIFLERQGKL